ncbi:MAG TPA: hypothetical protein VFZ73_04300 [Gemmatimonadaceae bacterium]
MTPNLQIPLLAARRLLRTALALALFTAACGGGGPDEASLRDSFAQQVAANEWVSDFARNGDELTFTGPGPEGGTAMWRIEIDSAVVEENTDDPERHPWKGTVRSSWYADGVEIEPSGSESNLPLELISNGVSQDCWALWEPDTERWGWE